MKQLRQIIVLGAILLLTACASTKTKPDPAYAPARPLAPEPAAFSHGAIYQAGFAMSLFEDTKARKVGDILTIVLLESTNASKKANTATKKENDIDLKSPTLLGSPVEFNAATGKLARALPLQITRGNTLDVAATTKQDFSGAGTSSQSNSLTGNITVTVAEVLSNGYLVVRGEKILALNEGDEFVRLSGIIRPQDIRPDNSVLSTSVANSQITYGGNGAVADSNSQGWLSRFFLKVWPF